MGKGGCDGRLQELANRIQFALCLLIIVGPILIIVGAILFLFNTGTEVGANIDILNGAVLNYETGLDRFKNTLFEVNGKNLSIIQDPDPFPQESSILTYQPYRFSTVLYQPTFTSNNGWELSYYFLSGKKIIPFQSYPSQSNFSVTFSSIPCRGSTCRGSDCKYELCETACPKKTKGIWDEANQICKGTRIINKICIKVIAFGDSEWIIDRNGDGAGCFYNFKEKADSLGNEALPPYIETLYSPIESVDINQPTVEISVRLSADPYLVLSDISKGTFLLGGGKKPGYLAGLILMIMGGCISVFSIIFVPLFIHWKLGKGRGERKNNTRNGGLEERHHAMEEN